MLALHERFVVDTHGQPVEVILPIADYRALLERLQALDAQAIALPPLKEWSAGFRQALTEAGYASRDEIVALTRAIKREQADERQSA